MPQAVLLEGYVQRLIAYEIAIAVSAAFLLHCSANGGGTPTIGGSSGGSAGSGAQTGSGGSGFGGSEFGGSSGTGTGAQGGSSSGGSGFGGSSSGGTGFGGSGFGGSSTGGSSTGGSSAGSSSTGGSTQTGCAFNGPNTAPGYQNLAPPMGAPLDAQGTPLSPAPPTGWVWYQIDGTMCRDGSPNGFYVRKTSSNKLLIYLEGGGACTSPGFCTYNPANVNQVLNGDGQTALTSVGGAVAGRQQPGTTGIFDTTTAANPFKDWNQIYIPYCTGDVHFGTKPNGTVAGVTAPQQFVGYFNMQKFIGRIVPTFQGSVNGVVLTGASAGGFGAALNFSMVQDAFGTVPVFVIDDSGPPFSDQYLPVCMQQRWRELWGLNAAMPPDCTQCFQSDGGGLLHLADFLAVKHPNARLGLVSSMQDEIIRLFYSSSNNNCSGFDTADPVANFLVSFPAQQYTDGLNDLRSHFQSTGRFATYYLGGLNITFHQHIWRPRFTDTTAGTETIAQWATHLLNCQIDQIGP